MSTAVAVPLPKRRIATKNDLFSIVECVTSLKGCEGLTALGRSWLAFYVGAVSRGWEEIHAPMDAINHAQSLAFGYTKSRASAYRAHRELENHGFITRPKLRTGQRSKLSVIILNRERFSYWLKKPHLRVVEGVAMSDISLPVSNCDTYEVTSNSPKLQTNNPEALSLNSNKSKKHAKNKSPKTKFDSWMNPVLYTIGLVLKADNHPQATRLYKLAETKFAKNKGEFSKWTPDAWWDMVHSEREYVARCEIIPQLEMNRGESMGKPEVLNQIVEQAVKACYRPPEIEQAVQKILGTVKTVEEELPPEPRTMLLDEDDLAVLRAANARTEYRKAQAEKKGKSTYTDNS